jgi:hypothetical protein
VSRMTPDRIARRSTGRPHEGCESHALEETDSWNKVIRIRNKMRSHDCLSIRQTYLTTHEMGTWGAGTDLKESCRGPF